MLTFPLYQHNNNKDIAIIDSSTNITRSSSDLVNSTVFYEQYTINDAKLYIGKFCSIGTRISFYLGGNHNYKRISTWLNLSNWEVADNSPDLLTNGDIVIGNDVWIGNGATILSGVKIGDGAIIGTNAVITKNVNPYAIVVGNPAKEVKKRFNEEQIKFFLETKWWDKDINFIKNYSKIIFGEDFEAFQRLMKT